MRHSNKQPAENENFQELHRAIIAFMEADLALMEALGKNEMFQLACETGRLGNEIRRAILGDEAIFDGLVDGHIQHWPVEKQIEFMILHSRKI